LESAFQHSSFKHKSITEKTLPSQSALRHTKHYGRKPARQRSQQHKHNMANHRSLKRTLPQAEIQKTSQKQPFHKAIPKQNGKEIPKVLPSANMQNQNSTYEN
jgi:hypothetical protein